MSNLSAFPFIQERSAATPGLWNYPMSILSANIAAVDSGVSTVGLGNFQQLSIGSTPPSYLTTAAITVAVNSAFSDYLYLTDSSGARSNYVIGSRAGGTADGLNIWDASGSTMIVSFSKQSVRFFQNLVGPVFDTGGDFYNAAAFVGSGSNLSGIQAAINQSSIDGKSGVLIPKSMYPYDASKISFIYPRRMVREGGNFATYDVKAYGAFGDGTTSDTSALQSTISAARVGDGVSLRAEIYLPSGVYITTQTLELADVSVLGAGMVSSVIKLANSAGAISPVMNITSGGQAHYATFTIDGNRANNSGQFQNGIRIQGDALWTVWDTVRVINATGNGLLFSAGGGSPNQHTFTNLRVDTCDRIGVRIDAGRNLHFINLNVEHVGLLTSNLVGVALTSTDAPALRVVFDNLWIESIGSTTASASALEITGGSHIAIRNGNFADYGLTAGGGGHGIDLIGACEFVEIDGCDLAGRASAQTGQRKIKIRGTAVGTVLRNMSLSSQDLQADDPNQVVYLSANTAIAMGDGSSSRPPFAFTSETSLGFFRSAASTMALSYGTLFLSGGALRATSVYCNSGSSFGGDTIFDGAMHLRTGIQGNGLVIDKTGSGTSRFRLFVGDGTGGTTADENYIANLNTGFHLWSGGAAATEILTADTSNISSLVTFKATGSLWASTLSASIGLHIKAGANRSCGTAVLGSNGSVNVANTYVATGDLIFLTDQTPGGTLGDLEMTGIRNASGFTIASTSVTDTSTVAWLIVRPT